MVAANNHVACCTLINYTTLLLRFIYYSLGLGCLDSADVNLCTTYHHVSKEITMETCYFTRPYIIKRWKRDHPVNGTWIPSYSLGFERKRITHSSEVSWSKYVDCCPGWFRNPVDNSCSNAKCAKKACLNGGICIQSLGCICPSGWTGIRCEQDVDECQDANNGDCDQTCCNVPGSYYCQCDQNFELHHDNHSCEVSGESKRKVHNVILRVYSNLATTTQAFIGSVSHSRNWLSSRIIIEKDRDDGGERGTDLDTTLSSTAMPVNMKTSPSSELLDHINNHNNNNNSNNGYNLSDCQALTKLLVFMGRRFKDDCGMGQNKDDCQLCENGWTGIFCNKPCREGFFGDNCSEFCNCSKTDHCYDFTGRCECKFESANENCACQPGFWGDECDLDCDCLSNYCNRKSGLCTYQPSESSRQRCMQYCPRLMRGYDCVSVCGYLMSTEFQEALTDFSEAMAKSSFEAGTEEQMNDLFLCG